MAAAAALLLIMVFGAGAAEEGDTVTAAGDTAAAHEPEPITLDRDLDQVVVAGRELTKALGRPISSLRLMAFSGGALVTIPFQIDELDVNGQYVMRRPGGKVDRDSDNGMVDSNDELIFMAHDCGDQGDVKAAAPNSAAFDEISVKDAQTGVKVFAYLVVFSGSPPAPSATSYMKYSELAGYDELVSPHYTLRFSEDDVFMNAMIIHPSAGGSGKDIIDRIKMRSSVGMLSGMVEVDKTEEDFVHKVTGVVTGPVRVIRQSETRLTLVLGLKSPAAIVNGSFYPNCFQFPSVLAMPFRMDLIADDAYMRQGWDLTLDAKGFKFYSNLNKKPVVMDGKMSPEEVELSNNREVLLWGLFTGPAGTFTFKGEWNQQDSPIKALLYYEDDLSKLEPPEEVPGIMGFAYQLEDLLKMGGKAYPFNVVNYVIPNFDGDIERALRPYDRPLEVRVNR